MKTSQRGIDLIKHYEGCELEAYQDSVGVWTIGYGHTAFVKNGDKITQEQAEKMLMGDLGIYESGVLNLVKAPITQGQFDALVSFAYNLGLGSLGKSTLLKKLNAGDPGGSAMEFQRWVYAGGKKLNGLVKRREAERALFVST